MNAHWCTSGIQVLAFEAMQADSRVAIDIAALNAVVDAYARCGRMPEAETCLDQATQRRQQRGAPYHSSDGQSLLACVSFTCQYPLRCKMKASLLDGIRSRCMNRDLIHKPEGKLCSASRRLATAFGSVWCAHSGLREAQGR